MPWESGAQAMVSTQWSQCSVRFTIFTAVDSGRRSAGEFDMYVLRSVITRRKRSLSYPARSCMRQASQCPSGEYIGVESLPGLLESFCGTGRESLTDTTKISLFVLAASTLSTLLVKATSWLSGEMA